MTEQFIQDRSVLIFRKEEAVQLAEHFKSNEFISGDGFPYVQVSLNLVYALEASRAYFNVLYGRAYCDANSTFRSQIHNKNEGGGTRSWHMTGLAGDPQFFDGKDKLIDPDEVADFIEKMPTYFEGLSKEDSKKFEKAIFYYEKIKHWYKHDVFQGGLGRYNTFTHVDFRSTQGARWDYRTKKK